MKKKSSLSKLMTYAGSYRYFTYSSWVLSALSALMALIPFWYLWQIIKEVLRVMPDFERAENLAHFGWMAVLFAVLSILVYIGGLMCSHIAAFRVQANLRIQMTHHICKLPLGFAESFGSGKLRKIINDSSATTETYLAHQLPDRYGALATPVGLLVLLMAFDWRLGLLSLVPVLLGFLVMISMTGAKMRQKMKEYQNALDDMSNEAVEYVRGIPVVKTFGQTVFSFKRFKDSIDRYRIWVTAYTKDLRLPMMFYTTAINSVFAFLVAGSLLFTAEGVTNEFLLNLIFYIIITPVISVTLTKIMFLSENAMLVDDALSRMDSVLGLEPLHQAGSTHQPNNNSIELRNVSYSYDGKQKALDDISLKLQPGQTIALVGPSGGGKTTLANILSRFFDPQEGQVLIGGVDVREMDKKVLMDTVSFVFQNSRLIKGSILENVRMSRPDASRAEVLEALKSAQCMDIIQKFPAREDTIIGTEGTYLSGGEQQRIAIARALLKNAPIVILDEATAFADPDNEHRVQQAFTELSKNRTVIMIAHRLSTIVHADCIYVLDNGQIAEWGTSSSLMEKKGMFFHMWNNYQDSVQWKVSKEVQG
ncbi:ABC transporter ATP-binding protein [Aminipila butyrica]|uniref:ABC transporter ATP-binding protein n=1 Tax=Aminipila butyrica TaxID=433296 RepID=A0A858BUP6_9FIRM|nr:ABC transporter ATP-binding protein [Aminipila butyrica]QIB68909.1 ABC transporter ATP-binding protein [Aminipila butyrica]